MKSHKYSKKSGNKKRYYHHKKSSSTKSGNSNGRNYSSSNRNSYKNKRNFSKGPKLNPAMYVSKAENFEFKSPYIKEKTFSDYNLDPRLIENIKNKGFVHPTKIQDQAIPILLDNRDVLGLASTGSGKTGAFLIPLTNKVLKNRGEKVLIIAPTRELANQIKNEFKTLSEHTGLRHVLLIGGASMSIQEKILRKNPEFIIATPGRLVDLEKRGKIKMSKIRNIVLDEVDEMLDMGFLEDIKYVISKLGSPRQSLFFSATLSFEAERVANSLLTKPIKVEVEKQSPLKSIDQNIIRFRNLREKDDLLYKLLINEDFSKVLIFSRTRRGTDALRRRLEEKGIAAGALHGQKSQRERSRTLSAFKKDQIDILIATDVAARGIDISDISHVINYDEPATYKDYIHRIGRTGRIGKKGTALTFVR